MHVRARIAPVSLHSRGRNHPNARLQHIAAPSLHSCLLLTPLQRLRYLREEVPVRCYSNHQLAQGAALQQLLDHPNGETFHETIVVPPEDLDRYFETIPNPACLKRVRFPFIFSFVIIALTFLQLMNTIHTRVRLPFLFFCLAFYAMIMIR